MDKIGEEFKTHITFECSKFVNVGRTCLEYISICLITVHLWCYKIILLCYVALSLPLNAFYVSLRIQRLELIINECKQNLLKYCDLAAPLKYGDIAYVNLCIA